MKTIAKTAYIALLVTLCNNSFSQELTVPKPIEHTIQLEATAIVSSLSINYNYIATSRHSTRLYLGIGLQYYPHSKSNENVFMLQPQVGILIGKTHSFDASIGTSIDFAYGEHMPTLYSGYRYLSEKKHFAFKAGLTFYYLDDFKEESFLNLPILFPAPTISIGYCW